MNPQRADIPQTLATRDFTCPECHYNLRGIPQPRCPECGREVTIDDLRQPRRDLFLRRRAEQMVRAGCIAAFIIAGIQVFTLLRAVFDARVRRSSLPDPAMSILALAACVIGAVVAVLVARRARTNRHELLPWAAAAAVWAGAMVSLAIARLSV